MSGMHAWTLFSVHPGLSWVEVEATAVEIDRCFEVFTITIAADSTFDGHDFAVHPFGNCIRNSMRAIADHVGDSFSDRLRHFLLRRQLGVDHSLVPVL